MDETRIEGGHKVVEYDPTHQVGTKAAGAVVVVVRDPDASNEYRAWTKAGTVVYAVDIDAGADNLKDSTVYAQWAERLDTVADELEEAGWASAAQYVRDTVTAYDPEGEAR